MRRIIPFTSILILSAAASVLAIPQESPKPAPPAEAPKEKAPEPPSKKDEKTAAPSAKQRAKAIKEITGSIVTTTGTIQFKLEPNKCPLLCANFCNLVRKGFFDDREWFDFSRVIRQCGTHRVFYTVPREFDASLFFDKGGRLAMSKDIDDTVKAKSHGTRFFLTTKGQERWNLDFPIFGVVTSSLDMVINLTEGDKVTKITVEGDVDNLLKVFAPEIEVWNSELEAAEKKGWK